MVGDVWELSALLGEALSILSERFSGLLLAFAEIPQVAWSDEGPFQIPFEHPDQVSPFMDLVR